MPSLVAGAAFVLPPVQPVRCFALLALVRGAGAERLGHGAARRVTAMHVGHGLAADQRGEPISEGYVTDAVRIEGVAAQNRMDLSSDGQLCGSH